MGGTSMAAPVVAGAAALQARPELNPDEVKALLTEHSGATAGDVDLGTAGRFAAARAELRLTRRAGNRSPRPSFVRA